MILLDYMFCVCVRVCLEGAGASLTNLWPIMLRASKSLAAALVLMPIIEVSFDRLALDIVGPLLKPGWDHWYILVTVDNATCHPEALPHCSATAPPPVPAA